MSIRNLDSLFDPASVALFGASDRPHSVGATVWRNLRAGGFAGPLWAVNPRLKTLDGEPVFPDVDALPAAPELVVICTPPSTVAGIVAAAGARGTRAAVVMTAGLDPTQQLAMCTAARPHLLRLLGPNCLGLLAPHAGLDASFAHAGVEPGALAFVSQSGALVTAMLDWARGRGIGFSQVVSLGEHADVDFGDMLDYLASDPKTSAILLYIEAVQAPRKFMSAARAAARNKPVIVVKSGRTAQGQRAAASHTGALAGADAVIDAAIRRAGMLRVDSLQDLFNAAETLHHFRGSLQRGQADPTDTPVTIVTNGGGAGVMAADAAAQAGLTLADLDGPLRQALDAVLPANWSHGNPVDLIGDAPPERYQQAMQILLDAPASGTLLFLHAPTAIVPSLEIAQALRPLLAPQAQRVVACWLGDQAVASARATFHEAGIACHDTPEEAVHALTMLATYRRNQAQLIEAPPALPPRPQIDLPRVQALVARTLAEGRTMLTEPEAKELLQACGIAVAVTESTDADPQAAAEAAQRIGGSVVLKILSLDISHKSDVGGVALDLDGPQAVRLAAAAMLERVRSLRPEAKLQGFTVQTMVRRPQAQELIIGASVDSQFGPVILFGQGGTSVEVVADRAIGLPPLNQPLAQALVQRTRVARLLAGYRDRPPVDAEALHAVLTTVSQLLAEVPQIAELDINPLLADADGVIALDARVRLDAAGPAGAANFAIRPYPRELVEPLDWKGQTLTLRPIRPEDEAQHLLFLEGLDPVDIRMRVFYSRRSIERTELARLTQIDYEREMAFIATRPTADGGEETLGVVRAIADPDNHDAEFGIVVRSDLKGGGLGELLMAKMIAYLRQRGTRRLVATVLKENTRMLELARDLGFEFDRHPLASTREIVLPLQGAA